MVALSRILGLIGATAIAVAAPAFSADVNTIAGTGAGGFSGDGGPAIAATVSSPHGLAVAADGTIYIGDTAHFRVRRIDPSGIITTVAGTGTNGDSGDDGQATSAAISPVVSVALSPAGDVLYLSDVENNRIRQVDLDTGVISAFAGAGWTGFGFAGDGGPAVNASLAIPEGVATDAAGNVYIGDLLNCVVRMVDTSTGVISTVAGAPFACTVSGDGGDALSAGISMPNRVALDASGNLYVLDANAGTVRRVDASTNIITTIAGGGSTTPGFGAATTMNLGAPTDLAFGAANHLYISNFNQVFEVDLATGMLSVFAGTGVTGFSGDGGPAQDATFYDIGGLAVRRNQVLIADSGNSRIRAVNTAPPPPDDLIIELATSQAVLDALTAVPGSILMINVDGREYLVVPNATQVGLDVTLTDNDQLLVIDLTALQSAGGSINISGNLALQSVDLSDLTTVGGSLTITGNPALNAILISGVTSIGGDLTIIGTAATVIDMSSLTSVVGSVNISGNTSATTVDMSSLTTATGSVDISGNTAATVIDLSSLTTASGSVDISGNTSATTIDMSSLTTSSGELVISDNTSATVVDMSSLTTSTGSVNISGNTAATTIDMSSLTTASGSVDISGNTSATTVDMSSLTTTGGDLTVVGNGDATVSLAAGTDVGGNLTVETTGNGSFSMGDGTTTGNVTLDTTGYDGVSGTTPAGALDLTTTNLEAVMNLQVQAASFTTPVAYSVTRIDPVDLPPGSGIDVDGAAATIDPVAAYQFTFAVPTVNRDAALSFDIDLAQLDAATRTALLNALAAGTATMATKGDAAGSAFQAFPICTGGVVPSADGCVLVETFDAAGQPTGGTPARVRFSNVVGHFSTWAVAIVTRATQANRTVICARLGNPPLLDTDFFEFNGAKGEKVTVALAPNPAGTFTPGRAGLTLVGLGLLRLDVTALPNTITATLPRAGRYLVTVSELLLRKGKFKGDYCVSAESTQNAWQTFHGM